MNRLSDLLEHFTPPELTRLLKRTAFAGIGIAAAALLVSGILGYILFGVGVCIGIGLGVWNIRVIVRQVTRVSDKESSHPVRELAGLTVFRIAGITLVVVILAILAQPMGFGAVGGVAIFYFAFLANLLAPMLKKGVVA